MPLPIPCPTRLPAQPALVITSPPPPLAPSPSLAPPPIPVSPPPRPPPPPAPISLPSPSPPAALDTGCCWIYFRLLCGGMSQLPPPPPPARLVGLRRPGGPGLAPVHRCPRQTHICAGAAGLEWMESHGLCLGGFAATQGLGRAAQRRRPALPLRPVISPATGAVEETSGLATEGDGDGAARVLQD